MGKIKTFILYVPDHVKSEEYAEEAFLSFSDKKGYDVKKLEGVTPKTVNRFLYSDLPPIRNSRAWAFENLPQKKKDIHLTKKSCFLNHIRVWSRAIELNEPVLFIEHDSICVRDWDFPDFSDVLILNVLSAPKQKCLKSLKKGFDKAFSGIEKGVYNYSDFDGSKDLPLIYRKDNLFYGGFQIPGTAAYAVTPNAAKRLMSSAKKNGWEQSDYFLNTNNVRIDFVIPEYFTFNNKPNLELSHSLK